MKWAVLVFVALTLLCLVGAAVASARVRVAEDNADVAICIAGAVLFGAVTLVLLIIWLAIT